MSKKVLVPIADGTEEIEAVVIIDILRRAGANVTVAGLTENVKCSRNVKIKADIVLDSIRDDADFDLIVLPGGGKGVENLIKSNKLRTIIENNRLKSLIAAICAAPLILDKFGIITRELHFTSHPSVKSRFTHGHYSDGTVVISNNVITSRGAGTAFEFALALVEQLYGKSMAEEISDDILYWR